MGKKDKKPGKILFPVNLAFANSTPNASDGVKGKTDALPGWMALEGDVFFHVSAHGLRPIGPSGIAEGFVGARSRMVFVEGPENHQEDDRPPSQEEPAIGAFAGGS